MIEDVRISNFKCFRSLHISDLSRVNVVGGRNNVGKTALLEALFVFHDRSNPRMFLRTQTWRGMPQVPTDPPSLWGPFFNDFDLGRPIRIELTIDGTPHRAEYAFCPIGRVPAERQTEARRAGSEEDAGVATQADTFPVLDITYASGRDATTTQHLYTANGEAKLHFEQEPNLLERATMLTSRTRVYSPEEAIRLGRLIEDKKEGLVEEFLSLIAPVRDLQISYTGAGPLVVCDVGLPRLIPLAYAGEGICRLLSIILAMSDASGGLVLVDEIGSGVHHSAQTAFWEAIGKAATGFDCQLVATTHSYELLRAAHSGLQGLFQPEFRYVRLEHNGAKTSAKVFTHDLLGEALSANLEVR